MFLYIVICIPWRHTNLSRQKNNFYCSYYFSCSLQAWKVALLLQATLILKSWSKFQWIFIIFGVFFTKDILKLNMISDRYLFYIYCNVYFSWEIHHYLFKSSNEEIKVDTIYNFLFIYIFFLLVNFLIINFNFFTKYVSGRMWN